VVSGSTFFRACAFVRLQSVHFLIPSQQADNASWNLGLVCSLIMHYACIPSFLYIFCLPFYPFPKLRFISTLQYKHTQKVFPFYICVFIIWAHRVKLFKQASNKITEVVYNCIKRFDSHNMQTNVQIWPW